jgi:hypothetical protein
MPTFETPLEIDVDSGIEKDAFPRQKDWAELDRYMIDITNKGYQVRAIVVEKSMGEYRRCDPENWGVITRLDRYQSSAREVFKPLVCYFFNRTSSKPEFFAPEDLLVVYPAKSHEHLLHSFDEQKERL